MDCQEIISIIEEKIKATNQDIKNLEEELTSIEATLEDREGMLIDLRQSSNRKRLQLGKKKDEKIKYTLALDELNKIRHTIKTDTE